MEAFFVLICWSSFLDFKTLNPRGNSPGIFYKRLPSLYDTVFTHWVNTAILLQKVCKLQSAFNFSNWAPPFGDVNLAKKKADADRGRILMTLLEMLGTNVR